MDPYGLVPCLPGTGEDLFVTTWAMNVESEHNILWLHGVAGFGKSTVATTLAYLFQINCLGAFIFFDQNVAARSNPALLLRTVGPPARSNELLACALTACKFIDAHDQPRIFICSYRQALTSTLNLPLMSRTLKASGRTLISEPMFVQ